ncbi:MAG: hypothetical protein E6K18_03590 [Methanobacteriota archaeon]|nr:MAG: hypothetical protein E6K18_03590 [Euryarchaeota archaeon]
MSEKTDGVLDHGGDDAPPIASREELAAQVAELEETVQTLNNLLSTFSARMLRNVDDLKEEMGRRVGYGDLQPIQKDLEKVRAKIDDIVDEVGYGEALDIAKVPPDILEAAYQAILDDLLAELKKARGAHDAEQHVIRSLEELRLKTSGSELFHYKPHRIHVGVARPLAKGLVSARQVQMTFDELVRHLLEPIHYHTPRNFRALIKIKSQEFAVDKALFLANSWEKAGPQLPALTERLSKLEEQVAGALRDVQDFAAKLQGTLAGLATRESVEGLGMRLAAIEQRLTESPAAIPPPLVADGSSGAAEERVLAAPGSDPMSLAALKRALGLEEAVLREVLAGLESRGLVSSSVRGRYTVYRREESNNA